MVQVDGYNLPDELYYTTGHTWARVEKDGTVTVGLDDFGQKGAKNVTFIDVVSEGDKVESLKGFGTLESAKWIGKLISPVSGTCISSNQKIYQNPKLIYTDPYGEAWFAKIKPTNLQDDLAKLIHGSEAVADWIKKEVEKYSKQKQG